MSDYRLMSYDKLKEAVDKATRDYYERHYRGMSLLTGKGGARLLFREMLSKGCSKAFIRSMVTKTGGKYLFTAKII